MTGPERLPEACDDCTAYAVFEEITPGVCVMKVFHDDTCPVLKRKGGVR